MRDEKIRSYRKIEIDNPICKRRFHVAFEEGNDKVEAKVDLKCPHCGVTVYEAESHPPALLLREENLVKSPDGSRPLMGACAFHPK